MSYFMTISGELPANEPISGVEFLPADSTQSYIVNLQSRISALDGSPVFLVHDTETGTSDIIVADLENALINGNEFETLPLFRVLQACFKDGINFRIWWADNNMDAYQKNSNPVALRGTGISL